MSVAAWPDDLDPETLGDRIEASARRVFCRFGPLQGNENSSCVRPLVTYLTGVRTDPV
jgi:hypothetical protein